MKQTIKRNLQKGFTLVELLIVVIILAILAAIVVPQFSASTDDAKLATLDTNLSVLRSSIELYKAQHTNYPGTVIAVTPAVACGTQPTVGNDTFIKNMTMYSDINGNVCATGDTANYKYGPYVRGALPNEPINNKGSVAADIVVTTAGTKLAPAVTTGGWAYDSKSGEFVMNSNALDTKSKAYSTH